MMRALRFIAVITFLVGAIVAPVSGASANAMQNTADNSRETAIPIGTTGSVGPFDLTVMEIIPDAWPIIQNANMFNDPPTEGHQFVMARLSILYNGTEPTDPGFDLSFESVGNRGRGYSLFQNSCGTYDNDEHSIGEMFQGANAEFVVCWEVATEDVSSLVMFVGELFNFDGKDVWFSLGNDPNVDTAAAFAAYQRHGSLVETSTREQPVPVGETGVVGSWEIAVLSVTPDATDTILAANQFNDPPADGHQFFMTSVALAYLGQEPVDAIFELNFQSVGNLGRGYTTFDNSCGTYDGDANDVGTVFYGGYAEVNVCWEVPSDDAATLMMYIEPLFSFDDERVWFSLGNDQTPTADSASPAAQDTTTAAVVEENSREQPIPIGSTGVVEEYHITVVEVIPDATDLVLAHNQFNDPPSDGRQFFMVRVMIQYTGAEPADPAFGLNFQSVGDLGRGYTTFDNSCGSYAMSEYEVGEMFQGATAEMNVCWSIPTEDTASLVMYVEPLFSFDSDPTWFSLYP